MPIFNTEYKSAREKVQVFDFQNEGALNRTGRSLGYGTPAYSSGEGWYIGTSSSGSYQGNITPPSTIFGGELKKIKIYFSRPQSTSTYRGSAVGIWNNSASVGIEYGRNHTSTGGWLNVCYSSTNHWTQVQELTGELTMEIIMEDNGNVTVNLISGGTVYTYDGGQCANEFKSAWSSSDIELEIARRASTTNYIRKLEITTKL